MHGYRHPDYVSSAMSGRRRRVAARGTTRRQRTQPALSRPLAFLRVRGPGLRRSRVPVRAVRLPGPSAAVLGCPEQGGPFPAWHRRASGRVVITGLTRSGPTTRRVPEWPEEPRSQAGIPRPLFEARPPLRKLVVVSGSDLLAAPDDRGVTPTVLLTGLLAHPYIKLTRSTDVENASCHLSAYRCGLRWPTDMVAYTR